MEFESSYGNFVLDDVIGNEDDWITIQSQTVTYDKNEFFIEQFNLDFPSYKILGSNNLEKFTFLSELCGRKEIMRKWFAATSIKYSNTTQLPLYLKDGVAPNDYKRVQDNLIKLKDELAKIIKKRNELAEKYSSDLAELEKEERSVVKKTIGDDNVLKIVSLTTESLPLSIQMKIQSYTAGSADADLADNRRRLAQEYLARFKTSLIKLNKAKKITDIDALLKEIEIK